MLTTRFFYFSVAIILLTVIGCKNSGSDNQCEIDAGSFPVRIELKDKSISLPEIPSLGITEVRILDSVMIVSVNGQEGFWHFYSLPGLDSIGSLFNLGGGPYEFLMPVPCFQSSFLKNNKNEMLAFIPLSPKPEIMEVNLTNLLKDNNYDANVRIMKANTGQMTVWTFTLDSTRYISAEVNPENNSIDRTIRNFSDQSAVDANNKYLNFLNSRTVNTMNDIPQLITMPIIGQNGNQVAELPGLGSQIVVYDTSGKGGVFINYKNMPTEEVTIEQLTQQNLSLFGGGYGYDDYFTVIRNDIKDGKIMNQNLDFITWNGKALGSIDTGMTTIRRFDIDQINGMLYCLDYESDIIKAYDIKSFLDEINCL